MADPVLLRSPAEQPLKTVDDVLGYARNLARDEKWDTVLVLSETSDGRLVFLDNDMTLAQTNWLIERMKHFILAPNVGEEK